MHAGRAGEGPRDAGPGSIGSTIARWVVDRSRLCGGRCAAQVRGECRVGAVARVKSTFGFMLRCECQAPELPPPLIKLAFVLRHDFRVLHFSVFYPVIQRILFKHINYHMRFSICFDGSARDA
jgi:hypothetical protein